MVLNALCLIIWCFLLYDAIVICRREDEVSKVCYICAVAVCVLHYLERICS